MVLFICSLFFSCNVNLSNTRNPKLKRLLFSRVSIKNKLIMAKIHCYTPLNNNEYFIMTLWRLLKRKRSSSLKPIDFFCWIPFYFPSDRWTLVYTAWNIWKQTSCNDCRKEATQGRIIMIWGMFSWHFLDTLIVMESKIHQHKYAFILMDYVHYYMLMVFPRDNAV